MRYLIMLLIATFGWCGVASAALPVLFFSDIESGPKTGWSESTTKGAAVSVYGLDFGTATASSKLTVCGQDILSTSTEVVEWGVDARVDRYKRVTFFLNSSMADGVGTISVTTSEGTSNTLPFTIRSGNIYFVSGTGSDLNTGLNGTTEAWRTLYKAESMSAGDITYVRTGIYGISQIDPTQDSGKYALVYFHNDDGDSGGTSGNPKAWVGYPGESVTIGDGTTNGFMFRNNDAAIGRFITVAKFEFDQLFYIFSSGQSTASRGDIRLVDIYSSTINTGTVQQSGAPVMLQGGDASAGHGAVENSEILGNHIKCFAKATNGWDHGIYVQSYAGGQTGTLSGLEVAYNNFEGCDDNSDVGSAIKIHGQDGSTQACLSGVKIHSNYAHDLNREFVDLGACVGSADIYNNLIVDVSQDDTYSMLHQIGFVSTYLTPSIKFYNNTLIATASSTASRFIGFSSTSGTPVIDYKNNIFYDAATTTYNTANESSFSVSGDHNNYYSTTIPTWDSSTLTDDPLFVGAGDYSPQETSPAVGEAVAQNTLFTVDINGLVRGDAWDIGAIEYAEGAAVDVDGVCAVISGPVSQAPSNGCTTGTQDNTTFTGTSYTWDCLGSGDGATDDIGCSVAYEPTGTITAYSLSDGSVIPYKLTTE